MVLFDIGTDNITFLVITFYVEHTVVDFIMDGSSFAR